MQNRLRSNVFPIPLGMLAGILFALLTFQPCSASVLSFPQASDVSYTIVASAAGTGMQKALAALPSALRLFTESSLLSRVLGVFSDASSLGHQAVDLLQYTLGLLLALFFALVVVLMHLIRAVRHARTNEMAIKKSLRQRNAAVRSLKASKITYRNLYNQALVGIFRLSIDGERYMTANDTFAHMLGFATPKDLVRLGEPTKISVDLDTRQANYRKLLKKGKLEQLKTQFRRRDGSIFDALLSVTLNWENQCIDGVVLDITALSKAEKQLHEQHRFLQSLIDTIPQPVFYKDMDGVFRVVNNEFAQLMGTSKEQVVGKTIAQFYPPEIIQYLHTMDETMRNAAGPCCQRFEYEFSRADNLIEGLFYKETLTDETGKLKGIIGIIIDITARKQRENELAKHQALLQALINSMQDHVFFKDIHGTYLGCNKAFCQHLGIAPEDVTGLNDYDLYPTDVAELFRGLDRTVLTSMEPASAEVEIPFMADGQQVDSVITPIVTDFGETIGTVGVGRDITEAKRMMEALREAEERYRTIFMSAVEGLYTATPEGKFIDANPAMAELCGYSTPEELISGVADIGKDFWVDPQQRVEMMSIIRRDGSVTGYEAQCRRRNGEVMWVLLSIRAIYAPGNARNTEGRRLIDRLEGMALEITEKKLSELELALRASTDPLTGLANRARLEQDMETMLHRANRSGCKVGVLFIDLDGFKPINDTFGHETGDTVLRQVGERISGHIRQSDLAARIGGDEFIVLLWRVANPDDMTRIGRAILDSLNSPFDCNGTPCTLGASIGGSLYPDCGLSAGDLLRSADSAMYMVKRQGKNAIFITTSTSHAEEESTAMCADAGIATALSAVTEDSKTDKPEEVA